LDFRLRAASISRTTSDVVVEWSQSDTRGFMFIRFRTQENLVHLLTVAHIQKDDVYNTSDPTIPSLVSKFVNFAVSFSEGHVHVLLILHKMQRSND
jgi:hypothetical protein